MKIKEDEAKIASIAIAPNEEELEKRVAESATEDNSENTGTEQEGEKE